VKTEKSGLYLWRLVMCSAEDVGAEAGAEVTGKCNGLTT